MLRLIGLWLAIVCGFATVARAADGPEAKSAAKNESGSADTRLGFLLQRADAIGVKHLDEAGGRSTIARRIPAPALKYQNPLYEAQSDGVLLIWEIDSVPVVFASYSIRKEQVVFRELATASDDQLFCESQGQMFWSPKAAFKRRPLPKSPAVPDKALLRLRVMKRLAQRFSSGNKRILTTPVHRYRSDSQGIVDGGAFVLTDTNDPEMLVLIEAAKSDENSAPRWRYTLVRMNSHTQEVRLDGQLVWDLKGYWTNPKAATDSYIEQPDSELPTELRLTN